MAFVIRYTPTALSHLRGLTARERSVILDGVAAQLAHQPGIITRNRKPMRPNPLASWELRLGDLRVFYDIEGRSEESGAVVVNAVGKKVGNRFVIGGEEIEP